MAEKVPDKLSLSGINLHPRIGVSPGERRFPQLCRADVTLWGEFIAAASADSLDKALDYRSILAKVVETAHDREYNLIETLAYQIARAVLRSFPVERVRVKVRKQPASMAAKLDYVEVEVEES